MRWMGSCRSGAPGSRQERSLIWRGRRLESRQAPKTAGFVHRLHARRRLRFAAAVTAMLGLWLAMAPAADAKKAPPPAKRTYFVIFLGVGGDYESSAACLAFKKRRLCYLDQETCGSWEHRDDAGKQLGLWFQMAVSEEGIPIVLDGNARVDDRLRRSSMGGAATITVEGQVGNFALVGREVTAGRCRTLAGAFNARAAAK